MIKGPSTLWHRKGRGDFLELFNFFWCCCCCSSFLKKRSKVGAGGAEMGGSGREGREKGGGRKEEASSSKKDTHLPEKREMTRKKRFGKTTKKPRKLFVWKKHKNTVEEKKSENGILRSCLLSNLEAVLCCCSPVCSKGACSRFLYSISRVNSGEPPFFWLCRGRPQKSGMRNNELFLFFILFLFWRGTHGSVIVCGAEGEFLTFFFAATRYLSFL